MAESTLVVTARPDAAMFAKHCGIVCIAYLLQAGKRMPSVGPKVTCFSHVYRVLSVS